LAAVAISILLLASINFVLLSMGRSSSRAKEVGTRRVVGAGKNQLVLQFWGEAILTYLLALLLALLLAWIALPMFNELS